MASSLGKRIYSAMKIHNDYSRPPIGLKWRSNTYFIISTVAAGLFTDLFLYGLIIPVLPFMLVDRVHIPTDQVQSHVSGLLAVFAGSSTIFSPFAAILADRMSTRQAPFLIGLVVLLAATLMLFLGTTVPMLVIARAMQGIAGAFVWTIGMALCVETVGPENLGKTIGSIFSFLSVGSLCSPVLGGTLYETAGYFGVCLLALGIIGIDLIMRLLVIEKKVARRYYAAMSSTESDDDASIPEHEGSREQLQETGEVQSDELSPLLGKKQQDDDSDEDEDEEEEDDDEVWRLSGNYTGLSKLFPIIPCLKSPRLLASFYITLIQALLIGSFDATIATVGQEYFGFNSLKAGILFLPLSGSDLVFGPLLGWAVDRYGPKPIIVAIYMYLAPLLILLRIPQPGGIHQILIYGGLLLLCGVGIAGIGAPSIVEAGFVVERFHKVNPGHFGENGPYAQLYSASNMLFCVGLTLGPELAGEMKRVVGYGNMNLILGIICATTAPLCYFYIGPFPKRFRRRKSVTSEG